jgi:hypothetical protein
MKEKVEHQVEMSKTDRRSVILFVSLLLFLLVSPLIQKDRAGEVILIVCMYVILFAAIVELSGRRAARWPAILLTIASMFSLLIWYIHPLHKLLVVNWVLLIGFFGFVSVRLFSYLGDPGRVTAGRMYASVSLYLILGIFWWAVYGLIETIHPGSFAEASESSSAGLQHYTLIYFSLATLTTLGYGDVLPISAIARICASLEASTGVFYVAIMVARLVSSYDRTRNDKV